MFHLDILPLNRYENGKERGIYGVKERQNSIKNKLYPEARFECVFPELNSSIQIGLKYYHLKSLGSFFYFIFFKKLI